MCIDENCVWVLIKSLIKHARREFRLLPTVRSRMYFLQRCSVGMGSYLREQEAYNMPCNHTFHSGYIDTWLLKTPSCPMCCYTCKCFDIYNERKP
ncbi:hypothetical protein R3W88_014412 [Solanum pinnatisectum]|uniref:RING-type domain-containing protein n=1 Tax=Solanum pinnatisectum TaxID=50273 RepID=A0AAV9KU00_9SOLN|nr:hypothetical protein R3W88_014412 [Solanum pinnatisectum]